MNLSPAGSSDIRSAIAEQSQDTALGQRLGRIVALPLSTASTTTIRVWRVHSIL